MRLQVKSEWGDLIRKEFLSGRFVSSDFNVQQLQSSHPGFAQFNQRQFRDCANKIAKEFNRGECKFCFCFKIQVVVNHYVFNFEEEITGEEEEEEEGDEEEGKGEGEGEEEEEEIEGEEEGGAEEGGAEGEGGAEEGEEEIRVEESDAYFDEVERLVSRVDTMAKPAPSPRKTRSTTRRESTKAASVGKEELASMRSQKVIHPFRILKHMDQRFAGTVMTVVIALSGGTAVTDLLVVKVSDFSFSLSFIYLCF